MTTNEAPKLEEMKDIMALFLVQEDWASINRYIQDLETNKSTNAEAEAVFKGLKLAVKEGGYDHKAVISHLENKSLDLLST